LKTILYCMFILAWANTTAVSQGVPNIPSWRAPVSSARQGFEQQESLKEVLKPPSAPVPDVLFGMHIHNMAVRMPPTLTLEPWPAAPFGSWRLWDTHVAWLNLEPNKGEWHFELLDHLVSMAEQHKVEVLLPLALSPTWASARPNEKSGYGLGNAAEPKNLDDWRNYVRTVATRYKGRVRDYEIWNEPNLPIFYTGDVRHLVDLTCEASKVLKSVSPENRVISPSATSGLKGVEWMDRFLTSGGAKCIDAVGFHLYTMDAPEAVLPIISALRTTMNRDGAGDKQIWDTESGWKILNHREQSNANPIPGPVHNDDEASSYIARAYLVQWAAGVRRYFFYAWDNKVMGLTEMDGVTVKSPAAAYERIYHWMVGAVMTSCRENPDGTWVVELARPDQPTAWIVWNPSRQARWSPPIPSKTQSAIDVTGKSSPSAMDGSFFANSIPKFIQASK
jgi:Glycosyl hydrolases family 39